jgi:predicted AlkP superfamily pyrophosphatase or phosphodiesterase
VSVPIRAESPRLILQVTVDQLRGDLLRRHADQFGEGGFRYLLDHGVVYEDAHHRHANTETIVGHTTLATGADPSVHGMIGNIWLDRSAGAVTYNIEDPEHHLLSMDADVDKKTEIDPTQRAARSDGRSPSRIRVSTFGDELSLFTAGQSKVFGVSVKDRGAVSMAGHAGKAFWFSKKTGEFVTSSYYYDQYPAWVVDWNEQRSSARWSGTSWELLREKDGYLFSDHDDRPYETDLAGFGRVFPHPYGEAEGNRYYTTLLTISPAGDELTLDFAKELLERESVGTDPVTDYLSVSFSSTDYVGHVFGPSSLESEDNLLRLDRSLAELFRFIDAKVGLDRTLIVLSADHGGAEAPGYLNERGMEAARYIDLDALDREPAIQALKKRFGIGEEIVQSYQHPYVYLDQELIAKHDLDAVEVESLIAAELMKMQGIALAVPSSRLESGALPDTPLIEKVLRNFNPKRSGDIYVVYAPHSFINDFDGLEVATTHGSPWTYDSYVPLIFAGPGITARTVHRRVHTVDVAPTLSAIVGCKPPSGASGQRLIEVLAGE